MWSDMIGAAERALADGRVEDAVAALLEAWRAARAPELAELIELVWLPVTARALPAPPESYWLHAGMYDVYPWMIHPWRALPAPDPRATVPLVLGANHVVDLLSEHDPKWPKELDERLRAHGDPRAIALLARVCAGRFADRLERLARDVPPPRPLDEASLAIVARMTAAARAAPDLVRAELARATSRAARQQLVALGLTRWLPALAWHVISPMFEGDACTSCTVVAIRENIAAMTGSSDWRGVRGLRLWGDRFSASDRHPWLARQLAHHGGDVRRALVALLAHPTAADLRAFGGASTDLLRALVDAGVRVAWSELSAWYDDRLLDALRALDPPLLSLHLLSLTRDDFASPAVLGAWWEAPFGARLRALALEVALERWPLWLAAGALPDHVEQIVMRPCGRTYAATATRDRRGWVLSLELYEHWANYDGEFEDPPTPGADLCALLDALDPGALTGLVVDSLGEIEDPGARERLVQAALRQRDLTRLVLPQLDGCDAHDELGACASCGAPPRR